MAAAPAAENGVSEPRTTEHERITRPTPSDTTNVQESPVVDDAFRIASTHGAPRSDDNGSTVTARQPMSSSAAPSETKRTPLSPQVRDLVRTLYDAAARKLTSSIKITINPQGIETPHGALTEVQIEMGENLLNEIQAELNEPTPNKGKIEDLSNYFYTAIPHKFGGHNVALLRAAIINSHNMVAEKRDVCQLARDVVTLQGALVADDVDQMYAAMKCDIEWLAPTSGEYQLIHDHIIASQGKNTGITVVNLYKLRRAGEWEAFDASITPDNLLFRSGRSHNWLGLLSRGILPSPRVPGKVDWRPSEAYDGRLGHGYYFDTHSGDAAYYTGRGTNGSRFLAVARVALGTSQDHVTRNYDLVAAPEGYDSCHAIASGGGGGGGEAREFESDAYVIYRASQQRLEYLCEFTTSDRTYYD